MKVWLLEQPLFSARGLNGDWVSTRKTGGMDKMATLEKQVLAVARSQENSECRRRTVSPAETRDEGESGDVLAARGTQTPLEVR
ncbi:unnamed protein product [Ectocarpus sp. 6 AP-2014]